MVQARSLAREHVLDRAWASELSARDQIDASSKKDCTGWRRGFEVAPHFTGKERPDWFVMSVTVTERAGSGTDALGGGGCSPPWCGGVLFHQYHSLELPLCGKNEKQAEF